MGAGKLPSATRRHSVEREKLIKLGWPERPIRSFSLRKVGVFILD